MKLKVPGLLTKLIAAFCKKSNELRVRIMIFFLLYKNIDSTSLTHSLHSHVSPPSSSHHFHHHKKKDDNHVLLEEENKASLLMHHNQEATSELTDVLFFKESEAEMEDERDARHMETVVNGEATMDQVEEAGDEDIDKAADKFIEEFKRKIQLQKQLSFFGNTSKVASI